MAEPGGSTSDAPRKRALRSLIGFGRAYAKTSHDWRDVVEDRVDEVDRVPVGSPEKSVLKTFSTLFSTKSVLRRNKSANADEITS